MNPSMTIAGAPATTESSFAVINPATGQELVQAPDCSDAQLDETVRAAQEAFREWRKDEGLRRNLMVQAAKVLLEANGELASILTAEQGKPLDQASGEIHGSNIWLDHYAGIEMRPELIQDDETARISVYRRPLGTVAAITPWNFPIALAFWKIAPALRAGNTVILKPSPFTPLTSLRIGELLADVFPPGVLSVISGQDPLGAKLASHHGIRKISFTGSTATGKKVAAAAADDLKRVTLELGGNDPAIILDDANIDQIAAHVFGSALANNGQVCIAVKRVYVPRNMYADVVDAFVEQAKGLTVGDGRTAGVTHGPINNAPQFRRVSGLVTEALASGAQAAIGGRPIAGPGYFYAPTVLTNLTDDMAVVAEEQFGPVVPVLAYDNLDEALHRANDSHYGLGSSIWTSDVERGARLAQHIESGTTWVNTHLMASPVQPLGGTKWSGLGVENGIDGLHEFTDHHVVYEARPAPAGA